MGWTYPGGTRKSLIASRTRGWEQTLPDGVTVTSTCLAHCYRGSVFSGVLWAVWERTFTRDGETTAPAERWITCDLLRCERGTWGYKDLDEAMHPYYYSCPLGYLQRVPIEQYGGNAEWREEVRKHHARIAEKRRSRRAAANR